MFLLRICFFILFFEEKYNADDGDYRDCGNNTDDDTRFAAVSGVVSTGRPGFIGVSRRRSDLSRAVVISLSVTVASVVPGSGSVTASVVLFGSSYLAFRDLIYNS